MSQIVTKKVKLFQWFLRFVQKYVWKISIISKNCDHQQTWREPWTNVTDIHRIFIVENEPYILVLFWSHYVIVCGKFLLFLQKFYNNIRLTYYTNIIHIGLFYQLYIDRNIHAPSNIVLSFESNTYTRIQIYWNKNLMCVWTYCVIMLMLGSPTKWDYFLS